MYTVKRISDDIKPTVDSKVWETAEVAEVKTKNWDCFTYVPNTEARVLYNDSGLFVLMTTDETPLLARKTKQNSEVCTDSYMEFFFRPNKDNPKYVNFEFNPFGTMYCAVRTCRHDPVHPSEDKNFFSVQSRVDEDKWSLCFHVPFAFLDEKFGGHTKEMFGNFYKCSEENVEPHWLTYYPVATEKPDYHCPHLFGEIMLEE